MERMKKICNIKLLNSKDIGASRIGIGMEKLDRDAFNPDEVYDKAAALGVKWARLQSGWQKTEKQKGIYDFSWLDSQVDNLLERKIQPWICLCYGNEVYDELSKKYFGAVGCPPIRTQEAYEAWLKYVEETVRHFAGRVEYYEIWNEPEGEWTWRPEPSYEEYSDFCIKTAKAIKAGDVNAKIITGSHYDDSMKFFNGEFANGTLEFSDAVSYHSYNLNERMSIQRVHALRNLINAYGGHAEIIQGESGSQSKSGGNGALCWIRTDENMQAKQILRHTVADIVAGVKFTSIFSLVDMAENIDAEAGKPDVLRGYFGVLGVDFNKDTGENCGEYYEKPSYYALGNLCTLFNENVDAIGIPVLFTPKESTRLWGFDCPIREVIYGGVKKKNGAKAFAYWNSTDITTVKDYEGTVTFEIIGVAGDVRLVDPMDGTVYEIPESVMECGKNNVYQFKNMPIKDYPLIITFGDFFEDKK